MDLSSHAPAEVVRRTSDQSGNASAGIGIGRRPMLLTFGASHTQQNQHQNQPEESLSRTTSISPSSSPLLPSFAPPLSAGRRPGKSDAGVTTTDAAFTPPRPPIKRPISALFYPPVMERSAETTSFPAPLAEEATEPKRQVVGGTASAEVPAQAGSADGSDSNKPHDGGSAAPSLKSLKHGDDSANRLSFSSLFSMGSAVYNGGMGPPLTSTESRASSVAGSLKSNTIEGPKSDTSTPPASSSLTYSKFDGSASATTTATDHVSVSTASHSLHSADKWHRPVVQPGTSAAARNPETWDTGSLPRLNHDQSTERRSRSRTQRRTSTSTGTANSSTSPSGGDRLKPPSGKKELIGRIGVCALDGKARSKPSRNILTKLQNGGEFEVILFGDKVILDEQVENWPLCDFLISFFSDGFPLDKAIAYAQLRKPFCVNDLPMQKILWDRRLCLKILDKLGIPTPQRIEVNRDGGPTLESPALAEHVYRTNGVWLEGPESGVGGGASKPQRVELAPDTDTLIVDGQAMRKPFVEKPISGEDHNIRIYFPKSKDGGGGRKLFRKIGNKSSEWDKDLIVPRAITEEGSSYIYEKFLDVENAEDVKAYTVGHDFCHAETRKSPVVDGLVRRNTHGKEIRYITSLSEEESRIASLITQGFGQRICGFDMLRAGPRSYVIDVNGWSFVKDNNEYYDKCASILKRSFIEYKEQKQRQKEKRDASKQSSAASTTPSTLETSTETSPESHREKGPGGHRSTLSGLRTKSPSIPKFMDAMKNFVHDHNPTHSNHGNGKGNSRSASPGTPAATAPLLTPPIHEKTGPNVSTASSKSDSLLLSTVRGMNAQQESASMDGFHQPEAPLPQSKHSWKLKGIVTVIRHADRTPKQKFKFTFHTQPFVDLLKGHQEEVLLKGEAALGSVMDAVKRAMKEGVEDPDKLSLLRTSLMRKGAWTGTKVQIKPMFRKKKPEEMPVHVAEPEELAHSISIVATGTDDPDMLRATRSDSVGDATLSRYSAAENDLVLDKLQLIIKWGGEPTHAARYQAQDLGENMRNDLLLMNREALGDVRVFTSSERRVSTSAQIWAASFLDQKNLPDSFISVRKDLLDDSNAAKDIMDKVKKKLKTLLREGMEAPPQFAWPANTPEPYVIVRRVAELMRFHRRVMRHNFAKLGSSAATISLSAHKDHTSSESGASSPSGGHKSLAQAQAVAQIQARWCCGEDAELFKERWEKLFAEFSDSDKVDPSKISELYDTMKFDALHNRQFLEWVFMPSQSILDEINGVDEKRSEKSTDAASDAGSEDIKRLDKSDRKNSNLSSSNNSTHKTTSSSLAHRMGFRRQSVISPLPIPDLSETESYFKLFRGGGQSRAKQDARLENLRELYRYAKILFDFICPQEYGISDNEKLEIGLLTSLPLLREITSDLEEVQASEDAKTFVYFTKESHIYTLLNAILEGGVKTKIARNAIPELDYLSQINFELYEAEDKEKETFEYSIRISLSPGCHTSDPLDLQLDSKHSIGCAPRRSLTAHADWKEVIGTLRDKFHTVKLPKSFLTINLSEKHTWEGTERREEDDEFQNLDEKTSSVDVVPDVEITPEHREDLANIVEKESKEVEVVASGEDFALAGK